MFFRIKINVINMKKQRSFGFWGRTSQVDLWSPPHAHTQPTQLKNKGKGDTLSTPMHLTDSSFIYKYIRKRNKTWNVANWPKDCSLCPAGQEEKRKAETCQRVGEINHMCLDSCHAIVSLAAPPQQGPAGAWYLLGWLSVKGNVWKMCLSTLRCQPLSTPVPEALALLQRASCGNRR